MKIIVVEKLYYPYSGPQDFCIDLVSLLRQKKHHVVVFDGYKKVEIERKNAFHFKDYHQKRTLWSLLYALYSWKARWRFGKLLDEEKPDIVHINNIAHAISPFIFIEARKRNIPIVYQLHDFKLVCPAHKLFSSGKICKACSQKNFLSIFRHQCVLHQSPNIGETLYLFGESVLHHILFNIYRYVDVFIAPSMYVKKVYEAMGFQGNIVYIPHFVFAKKIPRKAFMSKQKTILYVGRIVEEKGLKNLIDAAGELSITLRIAGVGRYFEELKKYVEEKNYTNCVFLGFLNERTLFEEIVHADACVLPSLSPESFGKILIESFSLKKPVLASYAGAMPEIVENGRNGLLFNSYDKESIRQTLEHFMALSKKTTIAMGLYAYKTWKDRYAPDIYYPRLINIYTSLLRKKEIHR